MKITKYLLPIFCTAVFVFLGCREESHMPELHRDSSLSYLSFRGIAGVSTSKGFTVDTSPMPDGSRSGELDFDKGTWDNSTNKPNLLLVVKSKNPPKVVYWAEMLKSDSYEYVKGATPSIRINNRIGYSTEVDLSKQKLVVYAFDKSLVHSFIKPSSSNSNTEYEISIDFPSLEKTDNGKGYKLNTADKENLKLIFKKELDLTEVQEHAQNNTSITFTMRPLGVLLLFDLQNISSSPFNLPSNYLIRMKTNGFSFEGVQINCVTDKVTHSSIYNYSGNEDRYSYGWDANGKIDYKKVLTKLGNVDYTDIELLSDNVQISPKGISSIYYALYVMPTHSEHIDETTKYSMFNITHADDFGSSVNENFLFKYNKPVDFYSNIGKYLYFKLYVPYISGAMVDINDFDYNGNLDNDTNKDKPTGKTEDFDNNGNLDNNVNKDKPKGNIKDFTDNGVLKNNSK